MWLSNKRSVQAKLVGNTLVATFQNSNPSLIWRFDLERNHSFTLALQGEEGDLELGVTSPKGEFHPIARFPTQEDADEAFAAVQKVLMKGKYIRLKTLISWTLGIVFIAIVLIVAGKYIGNSISSISIPAGFSTGLSPTTQGVPLPADQVLRPPP